VTFAEFTFSKLLHLFNELVSHLLLLLYAALSPTQAFADTFDSANDLDLQILAMVQQNEVLNNAAFCAASCAPLYFPPPQQQQQQHFLPLPTSWNPLMAPMHMHMPLPVLAQNKPTVKHTVSDSTTPSQAAAAATAEYYSCTSPQTSCDDSGSDSDRSRNNSNASCSSTDECDFECSSSSTTSSSSTSGGVKRKRSKGGDEELNFSRQRNKEYSKNWRSKKRMQEEALKQELNELRAFKALVEGSLDMMSTHTGSSSSNSEHTFTYASPGFLRMLNIEPQHLVGNALTAVVHEPDVALVQCSFKQLTIDSTKPVDVTYRLKHPITGALTVVESTLRTSEQGVLMVTRLR
jgi:PAS domain-containing protein